MWDWCLHSATQKACMRTGLGVSWRERRGVCREGERETEENPKTERWRDGTDTQREMCGM